MSQDTAHNGLTRREWLRGSAAGATALSAALVLPNWASADDRKPETSSAISRPDAANLYSTLLKIWCDGLLSVQVAAIPNQALHGGFLCPACALIHGRCGDAVYPLLRLAHTTGDSRYVQAAILAHDWTEQLSRSDGSWLNDVNLSSWRGITVFHAIALAEALQHHGSLLDTKIRQQWTARLARAAKFLDGFMTMETGNINYPVTSSFCFAVVGHVLEDSHYLDRARQMAHAALEYFTPNGLLFGEGHPQKGVSPKKCRPVDLGYNVEESLPALAMYALVTNDKPVLDQVIAALRAHMEFMLPDGGWDNSWGTRNYKWSWWGSRTSDGCHPAYALLAQYDPRLREVAWRNLEMMALCTHNGLLYGGPHYYSHGDLPCVHHTFTHAKALATVLDRASSDLMPSPRQALPRDAAYGIRSFPEIGTRLVAVGDWRATVTEYDSQYVEAVQTNGAKGAGGHASGGALSMLFHQTLGPILSASMTEYEMLEISNQQVHREAPQMTLTPRVECVSGRPYTSLSDYEATVTEKVDTGTVAIEATGRLLTSSGKSLPGGDVRYRLKYLFSGNDVAIIASAEGDCPAPLRFILPVVSVHDEAVELSDNKTARFAKTKGKLIVRTDAANGFEALPRERTFNLVPGFECVPLIVSMLPGKPVRIELTTETSR